MSNCKCDTQVCHADAAIVAAMEKFSAINSSLFQSYIESLSLRQLICFFTSSFEKDFDAHRIVALVNTLKIVPFQVYTALLHVSFAFPNFTVAIKALVLTSLAIYRSHEFYMHQLVNICESFINEQGECTHPEVYDTVFGMYFPIPPPAKFLELCATITKWRVLLEVVMRFVACKKGIHCVMTQAVTSDLFHAAEILEMVKIICLEHPAIHSDCNHSHLPEIPPL